MQSAAAVVVGLNSKVISVVDSLNNLHSLINPGGLAEEEVKQHIAKVSATFVKLQHLWRHRDLSLSIRGRLYNAAMRSIPIYGSENWPLHAEDCRRISVFDHRFLRCIARIWW